MDARRAAEQAARHSYGRLVAYLAVRSHDVTAAEDALGDAFLAALKTWPERGVPANPEAWLLVAARRRLIDQGRHQQVKAAATELLKQFPDNAPDLMMATPFPDDRLKLLFICAHPAIEATIRTPLMLQTVLGLTAQQIASAFLVAPATMGQRLVRAKTKIRDAGIPFELPDGRELPSRLGAVLEAIYAAYNSGWDDLTGSAPHQRGLTEEAIWLARLCVQLAPAEPEARGLLALMLHCEARRPARRTATGAYVPLSEQDVSLWSRSLFEAAEHELRQAATLQKMGRFQLEAAIQSTHAQRAIAGQTPWDALALLYEGLIRIAPTLGALVGRAAAIAEIQGADAGLQLLAALPEDRVQTYQPFWALKAHLHQQLGHLAAAQHAYGRAIGLATDPAIREFLLQKSQSRP